MTFSYFTLSEHPFASLAFLAMILAFISLWIEKKPWLWGSFLALSFLFAFFAKLIDFRIFIALGILCISHLFLSAQTKGIARLITILVACFISISLLGHFFPGFNNWKLTDGLYLNFDKPFVGFFPLALTIPLIHSRLHFHSVFVKTVALSILGVIILASLALYLHLIEIDLKLPHISAIWLVANLFFVTIPEEAFFRGFLQREITDYINTKWAGVISVIIVSLLFALLHFIFVKNFAFLSLTFIASLIYGSIYHLTKTIESSIFCHYLFNVVHFSCFTYPALVL